MRNRGATGVWELFVPGLTPDDLYKFEFINQRGDRLLKADPYGQAMTHAPRYRVTHHRPQQLRLAGPATG